MAFEKANTSSKLLQLIGNKTKLVIIDEAPQIKDTGKKLKLLYGTYPTVQVIATGSSAFDLLTETNEPLTGRKRNFYLFPISFVEIINHSSLLEAKRLIETCLIYGSYLEVINSPGNEREALIEIANLL